MIVIAITSASLPAKKRILAVCVRLFLEKGYKKTTLAEIIDKANVSYSSFQNIFRAKDGVLTELVEFIMSTLTAHSDEAIYYRIDHHWTSLGGVAAELPLCRRTRPDGSHGPVHADL